MAVLFRIIDETGVPKIYLYRLYRLLSMGTDQSSQGHMNALLAAFQEDEKLYGFPVTKTIKQNLVGLGADGASVNFGKHQGLRQKLAN